MQKVQSFRDLEVWQLGLALIVLTYRATERFPSSERFGITSQMQRAAVSIPSNVAEGHARRSDGVFLNHVRIALGSQAELLTLIEAAKRLGYMTADAAAALTERVDEVRRLLHGLRRSLERRQGTVQSVVTLAVWACAGALLF